MVSHPETGSDSPIGSDWDRWRDTLAGQGCALGALGDSCHIRLS